MLAWLSAWSEVQICIWYRLTWVVPDKWPLNGCVCVIVVCYSAVKRQRRQCELNPLQTTLQLGLWTSADDAEQCVSFATWTIAGTVSTEHICFCF